VVVSPSFDRGALNPLEQLTLEQLQARTSVKWTTHPADVLPLWVAEMDVLLAPAIADRVHQAMVLGDTGYPGGARTYAQSLRSFAADRWAWNGIEVEATALVPDVMVGIVELLRLITDPGDAVVVCPPVYPPFYGFVAQAERTIVEAPLGEDRRLDLDALAAAFATARRRSDRPVLLLCNPHNPTGVVHTRAELTAVAALAHSHGVRVIADEVHAPLVLPGAEFVPYLSVPRAEDAFALYSASKAWNLASLKAALVVAGPEAGGDLARLPEVISHLPSHLGVLAHATAFEEGGPWLDALLGGLDENRSLLADLTEDLLPESTLMWPEATYLGWLDCRALDLHQLVPAGHFGATTDLAGPARLFLNRARVAVTSGHVFGSGGAGFVRINYATNPAILSEAILRIARAWDSSRLLAS
jgi:cysteine-S-conjugate beta-lyase